MENEGIFNPDNYDFSETSFSVLMQKRIRRVLLICSNYDAFMLEEDGRIDEQIFNEYASHNLRYPPVFFQSNSASGAFDILKEKEIDLVIEMLNIKDKEPFQLASEIKSQYNHIPIVVLTHFSREVSLRLEKEDLSAVDYIFSWLGNSDILLAIVKVIEDSMNVEQDVQNVGVQVIILVEDSVRYTSSYLPVLYKTIYTQSRDFMKEGLNEHQKMLRMRGRPKILLAKTYDEAWCYYKKYKDNLLGIISDVSYKKNAKERDTEAKTGLKLCSRIRSEDPYLPMLLQSSNIQNRRFAKDLNAGFIHKYSKNLTYELRDYIRRYFSFGDFVFYDPVTEKEVCRADDLMTLQDKLLTVPDHVLEYHSIRDDFSRWLNARALFPIARMFKSIKREQFDDLDKVRYYLYRAITNFRAYKGRGVIALFDRDKYDKYLLFSRIGDGSIGGKARGLAFISSLIKKHKLRDRFKNTQISIPRTVVLSTEIFDEFMESNHLYDVVLDLEDDKKILSKFIDAKLPIHLQKDLVKLISIVERPLAIRSSSKLEDSYFQPFAGVYSTYMIPFLKDDQHLTLQMLNMAIKSVYASVFFKESKTYISATSNVIDEEKMGIIIQEICGSNFNGLYYPTVSGVARSVNFYPIHPEKYEEGVVTLAYGLGKYIVNGGLAIRFSPSHPDKIIQLSNPEMTLKNTQKYFYGLNLSPEKFIASVDDSINLEQKRINKVTESKGLDIISSSYDIENQIIRDGLVHEGKKIVTFSNILKHNYLPLAEIIRNLLDIGKAEMNNPIEIEFAMDIEQTNNDLFQFNFLQIRPIVEKEKAQKFNFDNIEDDQTIIRTNKALGSGVITNLYDLVMVRPENFRPEKTRQIAYEVAEFNDLIKSENKNFVLIGPGRWGSSDPWLGIPVTWPQISQALVIVEAGLSKFRIEPSQGTHFFHNLTSFGVAYLTLNPSENDGFYNVVYLESLQAIKETEFLRLIKFEKPLRAIIDSQHNKAVLLKP